MSSSVSIDIAMLQKALSNLTTLAGSIESQRMRIINGTPCSVPSLSDGTVAAIASWLKEQEPELSTRLDLAKLLDSHGAGVASYTTDADTLANTQTMLGKELADRVNNVDYKTKGDDLKELNEILGRRVDDPKVMAAMYTDLTPRGTDRAISMLSANYRAYQDDSALTLAKTLRQGLATASTDSSFDSSTYGKEMVRYFTAPLLDQDEQQWADENIFGMNGASLLAFMMRDVNYSPTFLKSAALELDHFEQASQDGTMPAQYWYAHNGADGFNEGKYLQADPMAEMMRAMSRQPAVSLDFFSDEGRRHYYFNDRDWSQDGYDGVSAAADAASTDPTNLQNNPHMAGLIASHFVDEISDSPGFNPDDAKAASDSVSHLLKTYMPSVATALDGPGGDGDPGVHDPITITGLGKLENLPIFYRKDLSSLTGVAMSTRDGMTNMASGVADYQQTQLNAIADQLHDHPKDIDLRNQLNAVLKDDAELRGFTTKIAGQTQIDDAVSTDQQRQVWINLLSDGAKAVPIPVPGADFVVGHGIDLGADAVSDAWAHTAGAATDDSNKQAENGVAQMNFDTYTSLIRAGVIPESEVPKDFFDSNGELKSYGEVAGTQQASTYSENAAQGMQKYVSDEDLETTYRGRFHDFYDNPEGD